MGVKSHPIIMSAESVRAILDLRKIVTRRVIKPQPDQPNRECPLKCNEWRWATSVWYGQQGRNVRRRYGSLAEMLDWLSEHSPYGQPGDRLWVRETWTHIRDFPAPCNIVYRADPETQTAGYARVMRGRKWKPSIHMPKWAARIWLEVTETRAERLQDMTSADACAEGISIGIHDARHIGRAGHITCWISKYAELWDSLNAKRGYPFDSNPWVRAISFKVIEKPEGTT